MKAFIDYYHILGVSPDASKDEIKRQYHSLANEHHPDRGGDHQKMARINEAYSILSDDSLRDSYDEIYDHYANQKSHSQQEVNRANQLVELLVAAKQAAKNSAIKGFAWFAIGAIVTAIGYSMASNGGHYFIAWGAILFGAIQFIKGLHYYFNPHLLLKKSYGDETYAQLFSQSSPKTTYIGLIPSIAAIIVVLVLIGAISGNNGSSTTDANATNANTSGTNSAGNSSTSGTSTLTTEQQNLQDAANSAKDTYNQCTSNLDSIKTQLNQVNSEMQTYSDEGYTESYNILVPQQNELANSFNAKLSECQSDQTAANNAINAYNQSIGQ